MSAEPTLPTPSQSSARPARRRQLWLAAALVVMVGIGIGIGLGVWWRPRTPPAPEPPRPDMTEVDPEVAEAIKAAQERVRQQPRNGTTWGRLGMVFRAHDFAEESSRCFREAERLDPREARWPYLLGLTLVMTDPDAGVPCLERAVELCGDHPLAPRLRLAEVLLERGRLDEAQKHLDRARRRERDNPRVQLGLGRLALLRGQWQTALEHLENCLEDEHSRRLAHTLRAEAWTRLQQPEQARADQQQASQAPEDILWPDPYVDETLELQCGLRFRLRQAVVLFKSQRQSEAVQLMEETVSRYPQSGEPSLLLGDLWRQLGRMEQAEQALQHSVLADPESADAWFCLGTVQGLKRPREAADSFRRAIRFKPDHALAHFNLGLCLKELKDRPGAAEEFRAALRCRPDHTPSRQALEELEKKK
jgi:tetratricopeptide (TPR) repeat protein